MGHFRFSFIFTFTSLLIALWWGYHLGGWSSALNMMLVTLILAFMEVSLSFDNAVVNASILKNWDEYWRKLFLTVGILIAVFGMRLLFPLVIVALTADMGILEVWNLALDNPSEYSSKLIAHHAEISAFGGIFLLLVFLNFMLDEQKNIHWIEVIEKKLGMLGKIEAISIFISIVILMFFTSFVDQEHKLVVLTAGLWGIVVYVSVDILGYVLEKEHNDGDIANVVKKGSIGGFLYLEVLDASFSFDGVIGAFAITKDIVVIMLGLGIGAMFVRSITIYMVEKETLGSYIYLEHGAHYAIGILALIMLFGMKFHIPEIFTGLVGVVFILLSIYSSIKKKKLS
ncbi:MAG TPA: DUF475 domain-containing protein [Sulfurimonas sp.]|uniref:DUF475 domain-containing protein n=1 Tax=Sulfurimonas sp. TaxID=2022749 RepID=UPI002C088F43|nr:DUF475 domain-containing protein [Sulfurimonas sp.]HUH41594.1 DUF475 domain-containing protein [Sulfurimonas sp.]